MKMNLFQSVTNAMEIALESDPTAGSFHYFVFIYGDIYFVLLFCILLSFVFEKVFVEVIVFAVIYPF